jgi:DNA-binding MarR family transcriptional regulator
MPKPRRRVKRRTPRHSNYRTLAEFRYLLRQFARFSETAARAVGLTGQQHQTLLAIRGIAREEPISIGALAKSLNLQSHSVVGLVNRLVLRRLVRRVSDPQDGRRVRVVVSAQGANLLARLSKVHREELQRLAPLLRRLLAQLS